MSSNNRNNKIFTENDDGSVTVRGFDFTETYRPWGHPRGFGVEGARREAYNNELRPVCLLHALRYHGNPQGRPQTLSRADDEPIDRIARSIPRSVLQSIYHLMHWPIELIQIAECDPRAFVLLAESNPALLSVIAREAANNAFFDSHYWGNALLGRKEKKIATMLGLGSDGAKYLRKIRDEGLCAFGYLDLALTAWTRPGVRRFLYHVPSVTLDVMVTAFNHWETVRKCPNLLQIAANTDNGHYSTEVCETVESLLQMRRAMRRSEWPWRKLKSLDALRSVKRGTEEKALRVGELPDVFYPSPPVSSCDEWRWVSSLGELEDLGRHYDNCALSYHWRCLSGCTVVYVSRLTDLEETLIVVINRTGDSGWEVSEVLGPENALVDDTEEAAARGYFEAALEGGAE